MLARFAFAAAAVVASATLVGVAADPAFAGPRAERSRTVAYGDLNLAAPSGVIALERRISSATRSVCGDADMRDLHAVRDLRRCRAEAAARAGAAMQVAVAKAAERQQLASRGGGRTRTR